MFFMSKIYYFTSNTHIICLEINMMRLLIAVFVYFATAIYPGKPHMRPENDNLRYGYQACPVTDPNKLNVHLIPYSYEPFGYKESMDTLFYENAQYIISSVVGALQMDTNRRFIQVETAYLYKWWQLQNDFVKNSVKQLINEGRLEIINGGWSLNDGATTHYQSVIDQFTLGHRWLLENFGKCGIPKAGWDIETNGHSREQASIYSQMGFDSFFIKHFDYRDRTNRKNKKTLDLLWSGSENLGSDVNIFTMAFASNDYSWAKDNFCYDLKCKNRRTVVDDESSPEFNQDETVKHFTEIIKDEAKYYSKNNVLITMGGNMHYQGSNQYFMNIDRIISGFTKSNSTINLFYSTPSCYAKSVHDYVIKENSELDYKTDDFLPVATENQQSWTGLYTSRPSSKRYERISNHMLQVAKQITALAGFPQNTTHKLASALGIMQYLEAIGGTEWPAVEKDYHRMLSAGISESVTHISKALSNLLELDYDLELQYCPLTNISICKESKVDNFKVVLYNPLGRSITSYIQVPVDDGVWTVTDPEDMIIDSKLFNPIRDFQYVANVLKVEINQRVLIFKAANLPPLGYKVYDIIRSDMGEFSDNEYLKVRDNGNRVGYEKNYVVLNEDTGFIEKMSINGFELNIFPKLMFYNSAPGCNSHLFKLNSSTGNPVDFADKIVNQITVAEHITIVKQEMIDWGILMIKIYPDTDYIEIEWSIGPIDVGENSQPKDIIIKYITDLETNDIFYTDSNGRELLERKRNYRPTYTYTNEQPETANYYPITSRIALKDENNHVEFAVITDRSQGGSSLASGEIELMIHRTCSSSEPQGEMEYDIGVISRGSHYITFGKNETDGKSGKSPPYVQRDIALKTQLPAIMFFTRKFMEKKIMSFLTEDLPDNVHLLTLEKWNDTDNTYLIRLEHFLEKNDDTNLSQEVTVDLENLFTIFKITSLEETTLNGVLSLKDVTPFKWPQIKEVDSNILSRKHRLQRDASDLKITLAPMQIRTFIATVQPINK